MADIFGRLNDVHGGSFSSDGALITFPGILDGPAEEPGVGLLTQNLTIAYQQMITRLFEIGSARSYLVGGRSQGTLGVARIIGPRPLLVAFYKRYGDVCRAADNNISLTLFAGCRTAAGNTTTSERSHIDALFCVITSIAFSLNAQDMIINEQLQMIFGSLKLSVDSATRTAAKAAAAVGAGVGDTIKASSPGIVFDQTGMLQMLDKAAGGAAAGGRVDGRGISEAEAQADLDRDIASGKVPQGSKLTFGNNTWNVLLG